MNIMNIRDAIASEQVAVQERLVGDVRWIAVRARGADWSWLTPGEAAKLGSDWSKRYGNTETGRGLSPATYALAYSALPAGPAT